MASTMIAVGLTIAAAGYAGRYALKAMKQMEPQLKQALQSLPKATFSGYYRGGFESKMTKREAALILGVSPTANKGKIREAHRRIMLLNHPDKVTGLSSGSCCSFEGSVPETTAGPLMAFSGRPTSSITSFAFPKTKQKKQYLGTTLLANDYNELLSSPPPSFKKIYRWYQFPKNTLLTPRHQFSAYKSLLVNTFCKCLKHSF
uniref:Mitochondrial import inner membrane translocase subunit TIM14 n=1 Tax=Varanus komodoensis TaxID=61221 RepID=A0A8D2L828_VARKO